MNLSSLSGSGTNDSTLSWSRPDTTDVNLIVVSILSKVMIQNICLLYMNDMLIIVRNKTHVQKLKAQLKKKFDVKDLEETKNMLGIKITRDRGLGRLWLSQENYILKVLKDSTWQK